jgi:hypothetical protein
MVYTLATCAVVLAGCADSDSTPGRPGSPGYSTAIPDTPPPGFAMLMLAPAEPLPPTSGTGRNAPAGSFWYRIATPAGAQFPAFEWYVRAQHMAANRAFRVEFTVDDRWGYSVGSARTDGFGVFAAHGTLRRFEDQYCVGQAVVPSVITTSHTLAVTVKADGSGHGGGPAGGLMDPERSLPCNGNGDGAFDYWLIARNPLHLNGQPTEVGR